VRFGVTVTSLEDGAVIAVRGDLDLATSGRLDRFLTNIREFVPSFDLDLAGVTFADVAGLRPVLHMQEDARRRGDDLVVRSMSPAVRRLVRLLPIELTEAADTG
jgi:anti-anti-sigma factor